MIQTALFDEEFYPSVTLAAYDWIVVNSSAGKDSQTMLDIICTQAEQEGFLDRVVCVHADLGRVEWQGTKELAQLQAKRHGVRFAVVSRSQGDLLDHIESREMFPSPRQRYCTSDHKRAQIHRLYTELADKTREQETRQVRILNCMGMRADESPARAKKLPLAVNKSASNGRREVTDWLPLHRWTEAEIWKHLRSCRSADLVHYAYSLGMPRVSCCFCIFAPTAALMLAGKHNPELLARYVEVEKRIGHTFRVDLSLASVQAAIQAGEEVKEVSNWAM